MIYELENLYNICCSVWGVNRENNMGRNRTYVYCRYHFYYLSQRLFKIEDKPIYSLAQIGSVIRSKGNDHSTILHGANKFQDFISIKDKMIYPKYLEVNEILKNTDLTQPPNHIFVHMIRNMNINILGLNELLMLKYEMYDKYLKISEILKNNNNKENAKINERTKAA